MGGDTCRDPPPNWVYSPPEVDRIWLWVYYNKIPIYRIFYLLKGGYRAQGSEPSVRALVDGGLGFRVQSSLSSWKGKILEHPEVLPPLSTTWIGILV